MRFNFCTSLFQDPANEKADERALRSMLETLVEINLAYLRSNPGTPSVYAAGVRYIEEPPSIEHWCDIGGVLEVGGGDCEDLAAWQVAWLRHSGIDRGARCRLLAFPRVCPAPNEPCTLYHVVVQRSSFFRPSGISRRLRTKSGGSVWIEDPSLELGMPTPGGMPQGVL